MARLAALALALVALPLALLPGALAVDRSKFRTCSDAGFCRRHRGKAAEPEVSERASGRASKASKRASAERRLPASLRRRRRRYRRFVARTRSPSAHPPHPTNAFPAQFRVLPATVADAGGLLVATLHSAVAGAPHFSLSLEAFDSGAARMRVLEKTDQAPRWEVRRNACDERPARAVAARFFIN